MFIIHYRVLIQNVEVFEFGRVPCFLPHVSKTYDIGEKLDPPDVVVLAEII